VKVLWFASWILISALAISCGGGGGGSAQNIQPQPVLIPLNLQTTVLGFGIVTASYQEHLAMQGGTGPYHFSVQGALPPGLQLSTEGDLSGVPTTVGTFTFSVTASDSAASPQSISREFTVQIAAKHSVRNDSLATADILPCCGVIHASLSPYSTAAGIARPDEDFYWIKSNANDRLSVDVTAVGTAVQTDTVLEIIDVSGSRLNTCNTPSQPLTFSAQCLNDDIEPGVVTNSHLSVFVPATGIVVLHVVDWGGRARPEMTYDIKLTKLP